VQNFSLTTLSAQITRRLVSSEWSEFYVMSIMLPINSKLVSLMKRGIIWDIFWQVHKFTNNKAQEAKGLVPKH
jgi:hypothetical protein